MSLNRNLLLQSVLSLMNIISLASRSPPLPSSLPPSSKTHPPPSSQVYSLLLIWISLLDALMMSLILRICMIMGELGIGLILHILMVIILPRIHLHAHFPAWLSSMSPEPPSSPQRHLSTPPIPPHQDLPPSPGTPPRSPLPVTRPATFLALRHLFFHSSRESSLEILLLLTGKRTNTR